MKRHLSAFIDALVAGRRPARFRADPEDGEVLRIAIALRAARPGDANPHEEFVASLRQSLSQEIDSGTASNSPKYQAPQGRRLLAAVAAALLLIGGSIAATEAFTSGTSTTAAVQAPRGETMRTGTFETASNRVMGQIVAYSGRPSWVFLNVAGSNYDGPIVCELRIDDGSTVAFGHFELHHGKGEFSRVIQMKTGRLLGARLVTSSGVIVASATFA